MSQRAAPLSVKRTRDVYDVFQMVKIVKCGVFVLNRRPLESEAATIPLFDTSKWSSDQCSTRCLCCGQTREEHESEVDELHELQWHERWRTRSDFHLEPFHKDLIGTLYTRRSPGCQDTLRKNLRFAYEVASENTPETADKIFLESSEIHKPSLLISIPAGARDGFGSDHRMRSAFTEGLGELAGDTSAWVVTSGEDEDINALVVEALKSKSAKKCQGRLCSVGICQQNDIEVNAFRTTESHLPELQDCRGPRDSNDAHFIRFDGETRPDQARIPLVDILKWIQNRDDHDRPVPVVSLLINGKHESLEEIEQLLNCNIPVVVVEGSGRVADILAYAIYAYSKSKTDDILPPKSYYLKVLKHRISTAFHDSMPDLDVGTDVDAIRRCLDTAFKDTMRPLMAVFSAWDESYALRSLKRVVDKLLCLSRFFTINVVKCGFYVPSCQGSSLCLYCERAEQEHTRRHVETDSYQAWRESSTFKRTGIRDYGEICFGDSSNSKAKFVRFSDDVSQRGNGDQSAESENVKTLLLDVWNLPKPKLVISVTGGGGRLGLEQEQGRLAREAFKKGLKEVIATGSTWVVTGGENKGVMKIAAETLKELSGESEVDSLVCIGVCTWGRVLIQETETEAKFRKYIPETSEGNCSSDLNSSHTHFLMIDDGTYCQRRTHHQWLGEFFRFVEKDEDSPVPVVTILFNGGPDSLQTVKFHLDNVLPVVVVKGSGRVADVLESAITTRDRVTNRLQWSREANNALKRQLELSDENDWARNSVVEDIQHCVRKGLEDKRTPLLDVFDATQNSPGQLKDSVFKLAFFSRFHQLKIEKCSAYVLRFEDSIATSQTKCLCCSGTKKDHNDGRPCRVLKEMDPNFLKKWLPKTSFKERPTKFYGVVPFRGGCSLSNREARYLRFADFDSKKLYQYIMKILIDVWKLPKPKLVISVTGGARNFRFDSYTRNSCIEGLVKMSEASGAWVVTGGKHRGVMKLVGQALQNRVARDDKDLRRLPCIGICTWGRVHKRECLKDGSQYDPSKAVSRSETGLTPLDPNHTHFLMVDDGTERRERTHHSWHARFHSFLEKGDKDGSVPVVTVLIGGGTGSLNTVKETLDRRLPVVVVNRSGRVADLLAFAVKSACCMPQPSRLKYKVVWSDEDTKELERRIKDEISPLARSYDFRSRMKFGQLHEKLKIVQECVRIGLEDKENELIAVYDVLDDAVPPAFHQLDYLALRLIFRSRHQTSLKGKIKVDTAAAVRLAMKWNRPDIMRDELLSMSTSINSLEDQWLLLMSEALRDDALHEFVREFIEQRVVNCDEYLTYERLTALYNQTSGIDKSGNFLYLLMKKQEHEEVGLNDIKVIVKELLGDVVCTTLPETESVTTAHEPEEVTRMSLEKNENSWAPYKILFLWALLTEHWQLAVVFWSFCPEPVAAALAAAVLLKSVLRHVPRYVLHWKIRETIKEQKRLWQKRAVELLDLCHKQQPHLARSLLRKRSKHWGRQKPLKLAIMSKNRTFVAHACVQYHTKRIWMGDMKATSLTWKVAVAIVTLPLGPFFVVMPDDHRLRGQRAKDYREKFCALWTSKVFQFSWYFMSYFLFLGVLSYSLLVRWDNVCPIRSDWLTFVWAFSLVYEDSRKLIKMLTKWGRSTKRYRLYRLSLESLQLALRILAFALFFGGSVLRFSGFQGNGELYPTEVRHAKRMLSLATCLYFIRGMEFFFVFSKLGPRLTAINKMIIDVLSFIFILLSCLVIYGVASQALLLPLQDTSFQMLWNVLYIPYWQIYGELFLEYFSGDSLESSFCSHYNASVGVNGTEVQLCVQNDPLAFILLAGYLLLTVVLLLNLLIAILNHTFEKVEGEAKTLWKYQRYILISSFKKLSRPPTPINWLVHILHFIWKRTNEFKRRQQRRKEARNKLEENEHDFLKRLEEVCMKKYLSRFQDESSNDPQ